MNTIDKKSNPRIKSPLPKPNISGTLINLRPIVKEDAAAMLKGTQDEEGKRLTGSTGTFTFEKTEQYAAKLLDSQDRVDYAITLKDNSDYIGEVVLNGIKTEERCANFRIALASAQYFNKGYGSEAMLLILKHGFETIGLHRIELGVFDFNPRAQHVYEKVGFVKEGVHRDVLFWEGKYHSSIVMSMLEDEWFYKYGEK